jgi:CPA2 family monovalent cation:H+ antiporter-2
MPPVLRQAVALAVVTGRTKRLTGWWAVRRSAGDLSSLQAGGALVARGEFSIVIAGLETAAGRSDGLGPLTAAYVLILALAGPMIAWLMKDGRRTPARHGSGPGATTLVSDRKDVT